MVTPSTYQLLIHSCSAVYPVGMKYLWPYFTWIIGHNSLVLHLILYKVGTEIHFNEPFMHSKFQLDWIHVLWPILQNVQKVEEKLWLLVSWKWLWWFSSNLVLKLPYHTSISVPNLASIGKGSQSCEFPVNIIYSWCGTPVYWATQCSLDSNKFIQFLKTHKALKVMVCGLLMGKRISMPKFVMFCKKSTEVCMCEITLFSLVFRFKIPYPV